MSSEIITLADLGSYLGLTLTGNAKATAVVASVNQWVENYTGCYWNTTEATISNETHDYAPVIYLNMGNATELVSVTWSGETISLDSIRFNKDIGRLYIADKEITADDRSGYDDIVVSYKVKANSIPADLKLATLELASLAFTKQNGREVGSESVGGYSVSYNATAIDSAGASNPAFDYYRRRGL